MAVTEKFSLWAFSKVTFPVICRPVPALLFWALISTSYAGPRTEVV